MQIIYEEQFPAVCFAYPGTYYASAISSPSLLTTPRSKLTHGRILPSRAARFFSTSLYATNGFARQGIDCRSIRAPFPPRYAPPLYGHVSWKTTRYSRRPTFAFVPRTHIFEIKFPVLCNPFPAPLASAKLLLSVRLEPFKEWLIFEVSPPDRDAKNKCENVWVLTLPRLISVSFPCLFLSLFVFYF